MGTLFPEIPQYLALLSADFLHCHIFIWTFSYPGHPPVTMSSWGRGSGGGESPAPCWSPTMQYRVVPRANDQTARFHLPSPGLDCHLPTRFKSHLHLRYLLVHPQHLAQCLAHSRCENIQVSVGLMCREVTMYLQNTQMSVENVASCSTAGLHSL